MAKEPKKTTKKTTKKDGKKKEEAKGKKDIFGTIEKEEPKLGNKAFAGVFMKGMQQAYEMLQETYSPHDKEKFMENAAIVMLARGGEFTHMGHDGEKLGTGIVGRGDLLLLIAANVVQEIAKKMHEETKRPMQNCLTHVMSQVMDRASNIESISERELTETEGLKNLETAQTFADMVKDLSADDIRNFLG